MVKLSFITEDNCASLGLNGVQSFIKATGTTEWEPVQHIDPEFLSTIGKMQTFPFGFTQEFKAKVLEMMQSNRGRKCLISTQWIAGLQSPNAKYLMGVVKTLNEGLTITETVTTKFKLK
ncbi:hypothetical protein [Runella sp.]|uniref:hypothetical protein n=1 Tax=Runella sp. TaxID=1960881 RepID=UPI003D09C3B9